MIISLIAAMSSNRVIARKGEIPWNLPADRKRFQKITAGFPVIIGRKTYESMTGPLSGRKNIVLSRQPGLKFPGRTHRPGPPLAHKIYLTTLLREVRGDQISPESAHDQSRRTIYHKKRGEQPYTFAVYERFRTG